MGILSNLSKAAKNRWFHASPDAFKNLDAEKLGTGEGGTDSMLGFHFSKKPSTAEGYLEDFPSINEDLFEQVHGMSISSAQEKADKLAAKYAKQNSMSVEDALDYKNPKSILGIRARAKDDTAKEFSEVNKLLNPYTYQDGYGGISSSKWLNKNRSGYIMSAELPDEKDMKIVDMGGDAYDEARHTLIGKQARDEGYKGVIFKNVVDDALSGSGKDDIALVFNPSDANIVDVSSVGKASPVDFSKLKSIATGLTTTGINSGALGNTAVGLTATGTLGNMLFGAESAEASPISMFAKRMKAIDDEIAKYDEIAEQYRGYLSNAEKASTGEILREVNPQYSKYYQELKQVKNTALRRSETENIRAVNDIFKNKRKDLPSVAIGTGALGGMSPEEQLFAAPAQREPEMRAIGGDDTPSQAAAREAAQTIAEVLLSGNAPELTSTKGAGETMMKIANNQPIGIMDALEVAGQADPLQTPSLIGALYNYLRQK
jgi:hypothetical protein